MSDPKDSEVTNTQGPELKAESETESENEQQEQEEPKMSEDQMVSTLKRL